MQIHRPTEADKGLTPTLAFGAFFTHAAEAMVVIDSALRIVAANNSAQAALGLKASDETLDFTHLITEEAREPVRSLLRSAVNGTPLRRPTAVTCIRVDGALFPAEITAAPFEVKGETLVGAVIHDRTESDAALADLRSEQQLYEALFDLSPIPLREEDFSAIGSWFARLRTRGVRNLDAYLKDNPGEMMDAITSIKTVRVNRAMLELMGAESLDDLVTIRRADLTDEVIDSFRHEFLTLWAGETRHESEFVGLSLAGEPFECRLTLSARSTEGQLDLSRVIVALQDVTALRAYARTLESLIAGKDRFVASISHELRTPLAAVLGLSSELHAMWDAFEPEEAKELMGMIARGASDLATLVEDLLLAAQIEVGNGVRAEPVDFELADEVTWAVEECISSGELAGPPRMDLSRVTCNADPLRVRQIVRNLVINAGRYGGSSVEVVVAANPAPQVLIMDDGPGIPATEWERIFSPYEQVNGTDATRGALGLGLAISRQLAEVMGGTLVYEYTNQRSTFTLTLAPAGGSGD
ncbi:MAG: PAS domain-containing sensor histidine kinase [Acidimicrobiia bacterium]|nr:PAS domain-containing sensor histidine kinase [Acidimicrobiia bacterium]